MTQLMNLKTTTITNINDVIREIETLEGNNIKWKKETSASQIVINYNNHFYKLYAYEEMNKYNSIIRHALAEIYKDYGIDWEIITIKTNTGYIDIECREELKVCTEWHDDILINYSETLRRLEQKLNFPKILEALKSHYNSIARIKLVRNCVNKAIDYAWYKDKIILLDDADWYIAVLDEDNKILDLQTPAIRIDIDGEDFIFTSLFINSNKYIDMHDCNKQFNKFFLVKDDQLPTTLNALKRACEHQFDNNIHLLCNEDDKNITVQAIDEDKLYYNNNGRKSFQWELWSYCNSLCKFCYLGEENRVHNKERQLKSLEDLSAAIDNLDFEIYNNISLIGGEFFQGQLNDNDIHDKFFDIIRKIFRLYIEKKIGSIWITCTLTIGDQKHLYELLDIAKFMGIYPNKKYGASGLWLCTSWDAEGRFHTNGMKENWDFHMKNIHTKYPFIKFNTTIILMQAFIDLYLSNQFKPREFMKQYNTTLFYKQCGVPMADFDHHTDPEERGKYWLARKQEYNKNIFKFNFFPTRSSFIKFLNKYYLEDRDTYDRLFNIKYRADELHRNFNDKDYDVSFNRNKTQIGVEENTSGFVLQCGHICYYAPYIDSNKCCICDKNIISSMI